MRWLKRNIFLIVGILVAVGLMALAVVYLISRLNLDDDNSTDLAKAKETLQGLQSLETSATDENIAIAQRESQRIQAFMTNVQKHLEPRPVPKLGNQEFASLLLTTISDLQKGAEDAGVILPPKYGFTFASQRERLVFDSAAIPLLTEQLSEVKEICQILFKSKVHQIESFQRVPVSTNDTGTDFLSRGRAVVGSVVITPYEFSFRGFTPELASVIDGLQHSSTYFVVKSVDVETLKITQPADAPKTNETDAAKAATPQRSSASKAAPPKPALTPVLVEQPIRVKLVVEVVKFNKPPAK